MRLVEHDEEVVGEVVEQRERGRARAPAVDVPRVVLDAAAEAHLAEHLEVVVRAHPQALRLEELALPLEVGEPRLELILDRDDRALHPLLGRDVVRGRERRVIDDVVLHDLAGERVEHADPLDLVTPPLDPIPGLLVRREDLEGVAGDAEGAAGATDLVALVLDVDEPLDRELHRYLGAAVDPQQLALILVGRAQAVDRRDARDDQHVVARKERRRRRMAEPLDLLVDRAVLLDVGVGLRDVGLGLVVVVVADEVLDGVVGKEAPELVRELGAERLVRRHHQRWPLEPLDHMGDGERLAGAGGAKQGDVLLTAADGGGELVDRLRLVTGGHVVGYDAERGHVVSLGAPTDTPDREGRQVRWNESTNRIASSTCADPAGAAPTTWNSSPFEANSRTS